jgi:acetyltransferase-like isoleucine patch superfamily enzyme
MPACKGMAVSKSAEWPASDQLRSMIWCLWKKRNIFCGRYSPARVPSLPESSPQAHRASRCSSAATPSWLSRGRRAFCRMEIATDTPVCTQARWCILRLVLRRCVAVEEHAVIAENAEIGENTRIGAGCVIGRGVKIGRECEVYPQVTIYPGTTLGDRVIVHAGAVLGSDGFGYVRDPKSGRYEKFPQAGDLVIEDDVEIGSNTTIDRGALDETRIGRGTKIDNLVHIGHNCRLGRECGDRGADRAFRQHCD